MLSELSIRNLAVVEEVHILFKQGFAVLTGETGAGKSIIIDALGLIAGGRGSSELVRHGTDKAEIEAGFELPVDHPVYAVLEQLGIEAVKDEALIIRREITAQGKSSSRINGQMVNLGMLKEVGEWLVNIHGQHEHQSLLKVERHIDWLDVYGEGSYGAVKAQYVEVYRQYSNLKKELSELEEKSKNALQLMDLYRYQVEEIGQAALKPGEDESLGEEKRKLANAEKLFQSSSDAYEALYGNGKGLDSVSKAMSRMEGIASYDRDVLQPLLEQMQSAFYQLEDAAYQLREYRDRIEFNPARLERIEQRLDQISQLRRKYGNDTREILAYYEKIHGELAAIENKDEHLGKLRAELDLAEKKLTAAAEKLTQGRRTAAQRLAQEIEHELRDLHMEKTRLEVQMESGQKIGSNGWDTVEFLISANPGEPLRSLHKIASGGELSRIMLAMKSIFARVDQIPVLVFDEVDTGVSGRAAQAIADKLSVLAEGCQVFSITHLPQVACMADAHYEVRKVIEGERTFTRVVELALDERVKELARMLGGVEITDTTERHAQEMLTLAKHKKTKQ
jgi:DNA repair protein RecN (Recombination protein N)